MALKKQRGECIPPGRIIGAGLKSLPKTNCAKESEPGSTFFFNRFAVRHSI